MIKEAIILNQDNISSAFSSADISYSTAGWIYALDKKEEFNRVVTALRNSLEVFGVNNTSFKRFALAYLITAIALSLDKTVEALKIFLLTEAHIDQEELKSLVQSCSNDKAILEKLKKVKQTVSRLYEDVNVDDKVTIKSDDFSLDYSTGIKRLFTCELSPTCEKDVINMLDKNFKGAS